MRIACLQFAPQLGDVDNNLNRADAVLSKANPEDLDLLVLPELAFTGYNFKSLQEISPFLEPQNGSGISALWARTVALKYNCITIVGYPEQADIKAKWPTSPEHYSSAIIINGEGETIGNYRKSFLYYTDETWALEGQDGFWEGYIPGLGHTSMGICMDVNPYRFEAPWHAFEFAFHVLEMSSNLVILTMAWNTREDARMYSRMPNEPDLDTLSYWISRLEPLIRSDNDEEIIVVFCNRTGIEGDVVYAGTSAVIGIKNGEVSVYGLLGRGTRELLVVDTDADPYAKLVYRPDNDASGLVSTGDDSKADPATAAIKPKEMEQLKQSAKSQPSREYDYKDISATHSRNTGPSAAPRLSDQPISPLSETALANHKSISSSGRRSRAGSEASTKSVQGSRDSRKSKGSSRTRGSQGSTGSKSSSSPSTPIEIPSSQPAPASDTVPTPTGPSPTPLAVRPKLIIPKDTPRRPHIPTPHPAAAQKGHARIYGGHVSIQQQNTILTPSTAFDDETIPPQVYARNVSTPKTQPTIPRSTDRPIKPKAEDGNTPARPSSPKSRNASRSRNMDRSDSVLGQRPDLAAISQRLETMSPRPSSAAGQRTAQRSQDLQNKGPDRPSSPKSRNASRTRPENPNAASDPINERHSNLSRGPSAMFRPESHMSNVEPAYRPIVSQAYKAYGTPVPDAAGARPQTRAVSRGRQPAAYDVGKSSPIPARRPSAPSIGFRTPAEYEVGMKRISPEWAVTQRDSHASGDDDEIVEEIIVRRSPSCAIHAQNSTSAQVTSESRNSLGIQSPNENPNESPGQVPNNVIEQSSNTCASSVETLVSTKGSPATPQFLFEPKTPEAMVFTKNDDRLIPITPLSAPFIAPLRLAKCIGQEAIDKVLVRPKSAVW
ncbi:carbon-nitrogen hydrolase [Hypoxylon trugodes]|uniref:carbon-nitrogen hydrolase n=1 Tax=Hypoxylon trugodes TaxID=326681 RepID=UPI00218D7697|nr:carbon-nitrogen hydrolase [Hypoxylon trugodes]KAI1390823.1 carbon-nitrogen hydrolase [Hypoxylon trugodes]